MGWWIDGTTTNIMKDQAAPPPAAALSHLHTSELVQETLES